MAASIVQRLLRNGCSNFNFAFPVVNLSNNVNRLLCTTVNTRSDDSRDPAPFFFSPEVQRILWQLTNLNTERVFKTKPTQPKIPKYEFLTDKQLQEVYDNLENRMKDLLQMPPVLKCREPIDAILCQDPEIYGFSASKHIFIDISLDVPKKRRFVLVRETDKDATLRKADWEIRDRMLRIFYPNVNQKVSIPRMFFNEPLDRLLEGKEYEYILDKACCQFEPNDASYIQVCHTTFNHIDLHGQYKMLESTRHFGPMAFYFAFNKKIDNILLDYIQRDMLKYGADIIKLYHILNPNCASKAAITTQTDDFTIVKTFVEKDAKKKTALEMAVQTYEGLLKEKDNEPIEIKNTQA